MKKGTILRQAGLVAGALFALSACQSGGQARAVYAGLEDECQGKAPCLRVRDLAGGEWKEVSGIDGFTPEDGYIYRLHLRESGGELTLVEVIDRTRVVPPDFKLEPDERDQPGTAAAPPTKVD